MDVAAILTRGLEELGAPPPEQQAQQLASLCGLLDVWSQRINLTGHRGAEAIARNLVLGAAALLCQLPPFDSLADLGSGAGFPGFPISILRPDASFVLVEARQRRHHFQRAVVRELGLGNVELLHGRIESIAPRRSDVVVAQALAKPDAAIDLMAGWVAEGGHLVIPGGESPPRPAARPGLGSRVQQYRVPLGGPERTVWIGTAQAPRGPDGK